MRTELKEHLRGILRKLEETPVATQITLKDDKDVGPTLHIARPRIVDVQISEAHDAMWVNIDGVCRFRVEGITGRGGLNLSLRMVKATK